MARKTREESLAIKHRILDAAELVLLDKGVAQTAMADLAEAAGMSRGAVYGHYRNKMEVCLAMCDRAFARTSEGFEAGDGLPAFATLRHAASHYLRQCGEPGSMQRVLVILYTKCEQSDENAALLRRAIEAGELAADLDVHLAAVYLVSLLEGVFASMIWTNRLRGNLWNDAEAMLDAGFDAVRTSAALRRPAHKLPKPAKRSQ
ncbi:TetR family transcriptional regulator [Burkholderia multivorans]|uniref:TetR family transcriptional regulator n=1 Tax=Burkholderia multivorans TaxID=87883 RepID=UPI001C243719|nr:TetR family transcriptional regulator [Burkholderia multivorans]MBU9339563.1 TetR family transcriptional regulator [Burkholderia multivorans]